MTSAERDALKAAIAMPYPAFPCLLTKAPACPHGFRDACTAASGLATLWARYPGELVGVPTGAATGIAVLDIDKRSGGGEWWAANKARIPATRMHRTRSGGLHLLLKHKDGLRNSAGKIAAGVDVRATGGFIIWWPACGLEVRDAPLADWPDCLAPPEPPPPTPYIRAWPRPAGAAYSPTVENKLRGIAQFVARASKGQRNAIVYWAACRVAELMNVGAVDPAFASATLIEAARMAGLPEIEARRTVDSALRRAA
jgi:Bifunctional DNA primase/polymerase, N-terminal